MFDTSSGSLSAPFAAPSLLMDPYQAGATSALNSESSVPSLAMPTEVALGHPPTQDAESAVVESHGCVQETWDWQPLPDGLIYRSYLAGFKEPRMHSLWCRSRIWAGFGTLPLVGESAFCVMETTTTQCPMAGSLTSRGPDSRGWILRRTETLWQLIFGPAPRLPLARDPTCAKLAYHHLSSHLGDEFLLKNPTVIRYNYSREVLVLGQSYYVHPDLARLRRSGLGVLFRRGRRMGVSVRH